MQRVDRQRVRLEPAEHEPAAGRAQVDGGIGHPGDRVGRVDECRGRGDQQLVADHSDRHPRPGQAGDVAYPAACRVHDHRRRDRPTVRLDTGHPAGRDRYPGDRLVFGDHGPVQPTGRQAGLDEAGRLVDIDVLRAPQAEVVAGRLVVAAARPASCARVASRTSAPQRRDCASSRQRSWRCRAVRAIRKLPGLATGRDVPAQSAKVIALAMLRRASRVRSSSAWTDLNRPAARPEACDPAVWRSTTATDRPASAQCKAVLRPSAPAPITTTSASTRPLCRIPRASWRGLREAEVSTGHDYSPPGKPKIDWDGPAAQETLVSGQVPARADRHFGAPVPARRFHLACPLSSDVGGWLAA